LGTYQYSTNYVNLAQANELSHKREEPLAQATSSRLGEIANREHIEVALKLAHLAQARGLRIGEPSKYRGGGELLLFSLRRELLVWAKNNSLRRA